MSSSIVIKYPKNWVEAIKIARILDKEWFDLHKEKYRIEKRKRLINIINIVKELLLASEDIDDVKDKEAVKIIIKTWIRRHKLRIR